MTNYLLDIGFDINAVQTQSQNPNQGNVSYLQYGLAMPNGNSGWMAGSFNGLNINDTIGCNAFDTTETSSNYSVQSVEFIFTNADTQQQSTCPSNKAVTLGNNTTGSFQPTSNGAGQFLKIGLISIPRNGPAGENTSVILGPGGQLFNSWVIIPQGGLAINLSGRYLFTITLTVLSQDSTVTRTFVADPEMIVWGPGN